MQRSILIVTMCRGDRGVHKLKFWHQLRMDWKVDNFGCLFKAHERVSPPAFLQTFPSSFLFRLQAEGVYEGNLYKALPQSRLGLVKCRRNVFELV